MKKQIYASIWAETEKAWALLTDVNVNTMAFSGDVEWFSKSLCELDGYKLTVPEWLLKKKGITNYKEYYEED